MRRITSGRTRCESHPPTKHHEAPLEGPTRGSRTLWESFTLLPRLLAGDYSTPKSFRRSIITCAPGRWSVVSSSKRISRGRGLGNVLTQTITGPD